MVHLVDSFILGLLQSLFPLTHPVVFAVIMDHPVTGVCRQDVLFKVPFLAGKSLPVTHLQVWPLRQLLQLELEVTVQECTLHYSPRHRHVFRLWQSFLFSHL